MTDQTTGVDELRERYRPKTVRLLFVGESSPTGGPHFYKADSNLYFATREAYVAAEGLDSMREGASFLQYFQRQGCWLIDLATRPVNRLPTSERRHDLAVGVPRLTSILKDEEPEHVVAIKVSIAANVFTAARGARYPIDSVSSLRFPLYQWRTDCVRGLKSLLERVIGRGAEARKERSTSEAAAKTSKGSSFRASEPLKLHEAIAEVLRDGGNRRMAPREIADEIARRRSYVRPSDGGTPPPSQIRARVRVPTYCHMFEIQSGRIWLRT